MFIWRWDMGTTGNKADQVKVSKRKPEHVFLFGQVYPTRVLLFLVEE